MPKSNKSAEEFVARWQGRGNEDSDSQHFWNDFLQNVIGIESTDLPNFIDYEHKVRGKAPDGQIHTRKADGYIASHDVLIEQKSITEPLDKKRNNDIWGYESAIEQALWYCHHMPKNSQPSWIITCNFATFRVYDLNQEVPEDHPLEIRLEELPCNLNLFNFLYSEQSLRVYKEQRLSVKAGEHVTALYNALREQYAKLSSSTVDNSSLNSLVTRIVFLLYAEDAELLPTVSAFSDYCEGPASELKRKLGDIFRILDTPKHMRGCLDVDPPDPLLADWPYVNGGLFHDDPTNTTVIPWITDESVCQAIREASHFNWSEINPTIFGAVFEDTLNPLTNKEGGLRYTSIANIHKAIDPLFLDELWAELEAAKSDSVPKTRRRALERLHRKIASIRILDPACGSGNFLTESYIQLRAIENQILLYEAEAGKSFARSEDPIKVTLDHFYGIEINDFAVSIAKTALWISEQQAMDATQAYLPDVDLQFLPLRNIDTIVESNALKLDWNSLLPAHQCSYIVGNPEYCGSKKQTKRQKAEIKELFKGCRRPGNNDYCSGWFIKAAKYMGSGCRAAFLSTDSICQGEQVASVWKPMYDQGMHIDFAHNTFRWSNEAAETSSVFCIVVGFSRESVPKILYVHDTPDSPERVLHPSNINAYLRDAPDVFIWSLDEPVSATLVMRSGNKPIDNQNYLFSTTAKDEFIRAEPGSERFFHPYVGGREFLNGYTRWCLWLGDASPYELSQLPLCTERVERVRAFRLNSTDRGTRELANRPTRFHVETMPTEESLVIPETSSEYRGYIPWGFVGPENICSNQLKLVEGAGLYHFGVLQSKFHHAWMSAVSGRHEGRFRYSIEVVYNNFVWPNPNAEQKSRIEEAASDVLTARAGCSQLRLGDMYTQLAVEYEGESASSRAGIADGIDDLRKAHRKLDLAVEAAYGVAFNGDSDKIVNHLFGLLSKRLNE